MKTLFSNKCLFLTPILLYCFALSSSEEMFPLRAMTWNGGKGKGDESFNFVVVGTKSGFPISVACSFYKDEGMDKPKYEAKRKYRDGLYSIEIDGKTVELDDSLVVVVNNNLGRPVVLKFSGQMAIKRSLAIFKADRDPSFEQLQKYWNEIVKPEVEKTLNPISEK